MNRDLLNEQGVDYFTLLFSLLELLLSAGFTTLALMIQSVELPNASYLASQAS
jgi:hypothetical protein